jgi:hypothetical protein
MAENIISLRGEGEIFIPFSEKEVNRKLELAGTCPLLFVLFGKETRSGPGRKGIRP